MATKLAKIVADFRTSLATKIAVGGTTATLQSATDDDGVSLPAGQYFFTLDGDSSQKEHIVCTLSGTSLSSIKSITRQGVQSSGAVREHRIGSSVTITNFAHIKYINDLLDGTTNLNASLPLEYDATASITTANQLATKDYVDGVAIAGGADASTTVKGISKLSTAPASATDPIAVGDNDTRIPTQDENDALVGTSGTPSTSNKFVTADDATATPTADKIVRADGSGKLDDWITQYTYADGTDGDVTISSNTNLARDMYYNNLTIDSGFTLNPSGYRIFVAGTLTNNGTIARNGVAGTNGTNGTSGVAGVKGTGGAALATGSIFGSVAGKDGINGVLGNNGSANGTNGTAGSAQNPSITGINGSAGGTGGTGGLTPGSGGAGGAATIETNNFNFGAFYSGVLNSETSISIVPYLLNGATSFNQLSSSAGSGSGGTGFWTANASASTAGGGSGASGSGGGIVYIQAKTIINNGAFEAKGGAGGNGGDSFTSNGTNGVASGPGGGGGGAGGLVVLVYNSLSGAGTIDVTGGAGGAGGAAATGSYATANNGSAGTAGNTGKYIKIQLNS